ncbi:hypothetical protein KP509_11G040900 [Ceratopteris richardii]|nr:hypothetical protein KP509_11G040900 [Ceratopteris richardii]
MTRLGYDSSPFLSDHLIRLLGSYASLLEANLVFCLASRPCVFTWQAILSAHCSHGEYCMTLLLYYKMLDHGICADRVTYLCVLKACAALQDDKQAYIFHRYIVDSQNDRDIKIGNMLVYTYANCARLDDATSVFSRLRQKTVVSWTAIIATYVQHGYDTVALEQFQSMMRNGVIPDDFAFTSALKACTNLVNVQSGRLIHSWTVLHGLEVTVAVGSAIIDMYGKCGSIAEAQDVFNKLSSKNIVTWNAMITAYCEHGKMICAQELFDTMGNNFIQQNVISWNAMISGYTKCNKAFASIELYQRMQYRNIKPDAVTYLCALKACASVGALVNGRIVHKKIHACGLDSTLAIGNTLIDMYCKCCSLKEALEVLSAMPQRDVISWGAVIGGLTQHSRYELALQCFQDMQEEGIRPVYDTYVSVLTACKCLKHVDEGYYYFKSMQEKHGIKPGMVHFNCMIDLLGHAGSLHEAVRMLHMIPSLSNLQGWMSLLTASKKFGNTELAYACFDQVVRLDPSISSSYVIMSSAYNN